MSKWTLRSWAALWALVLTLAAAAGAAGPEAIDPADDDLARLAEVGRFDHLAEALRAIPEADSHPEVSALLRELDAFQRHRDDQSAKRGEAFDQAVAKMNEQAAAGKLEDAVVSAVEAHGLSDDPEGFLNAPATSDLVKRMEAVAQQAERDDQWIDALSQYRLLNMLFEDHGTYQEHEKRASRHVRVLRIYAPETLERLLQQRADRAAAEEELEGEGKPEKPDPVRLDKEPWQKRLAGVDMSMVTEVLRTAAQKHVSSRGYSKLLGGAIDGLGVVANTGALTNAFPSMGDPAKLTAFLAALDQVRGKIDRQLTTLDARERGGRDRAASAAAAILDELLAANDRTIDLPRPVVAFEIAEGALSTLDDYTAVIWPFERDAFARNFEGGFYGVGIQIGQKLNPKSAREELLVISPLEGTPAQRAGIRAQDVIVTVNGQETLDWSLDQAVREITGPEGTNVTLGIRRAGHDEPLPFKLTRAKIPIESIRGWAHKPAGGWDYYIDPEHRIGYVRLSQFIPQTAADLDAAINQMDKQGGLNGLILDLRFNPGGLLTSAVEICDRFIQSGPIVSTVGPEDTRTSSFSARPDHTHRGFPVVVLINKGSASASEIVSGALQDYGRALVVGARSWGKGSVQDVFPVDSGRAYLKLTTQYYKLPKNRIIHREPLSRTWGVEPDLKVVMTSQQIVDALEFRQKVDVLRSADEPVDPEKPAPTADEILEKGIDPQLTTALLVLRTRLLADEVGTLRNAKAAAAAR